MMEKIDLNVGRGFSDCITVMFNFVKQEFKPLMKAAGFIVLPLLLVDMVLRSFFISDIFAYTSLIDEGDVLWDAGYWRGMGVNYLTMVVAYFWIALFALSYMRIYAERFAEGDAAPVLPGEVWQVMGKSMGVSLLWLVFYFLMVCFGMLLFLIPGIYVAVVFVFVLCFIVIAGKSLSNSMSASMKIMSGKWWNTFGYLLVLGMLVSALSYVFSLPYMFLSIKTIVVGEEPSTYALALGVLLSTLGQYLLQLVAFVGIGVRFFSLREQKEHAALLDKINEIGKN